MKVMVICPGLRYYFFDAVEDSNVIVLEEPFVRENGILKKNLIRIAKKLDLWKVYRRAILGWREYLPESNDIVIFDKAFSVAIVKAIRAMQPEVKIHIYIWNTIIKGDSIIKELNKIKGLVDVYSFDKNDCEKYGFNFSPMVYNLDNPVYIHEDNKNTQHDIIFVGYIKNRGNYLSKLYTSFEMQNLRLFFYVVSKKKVKQDMPFAVHKNYLDYSDYQKEMSSAKAVLDITKEGQIGLTIRTLETIAYKKKLITNNIDVINYDFYNANNIFVLGVDNLDRIKDFLTTPYVDIDWEILKKYNFCDWAKNFRHEGESCD